MKLRSMQIRQPPEVVEAFKTYANSLFAAHGVGATASGGDKRVSHWWGSFTDHYGESDLLRAMAEMEGREPFREVRREKADEIPAGYFLCQSSPLVIKIAGSGPRKTDYLLSRAPSRAAWLEAVRTGPGLPVPPMPENASEREWLEAAMDAAEVRGLAPTPELLATAIQHWRQA